MYTLGFNLFGIELALRLMQTNLNYEYCGIFEANFELSESLIAIINNQRKWLAL